MSRRNPFLAAAFSFILAGLGQFYVDRFMRGVLFLLGEVVTACYALFIERNIGLALNLLVSVWSAVDAYKIAKSTEETPLKKQPEREIFV